MSDSGGLDISKVVGLIMENPNLIEEISKLAKDSGANEEKDVQPEEVKQEVKAPSPATYKKTDVRGQRRSELLSAIKPYLSEERAKAIDSMITIVDVLGMMNGR